MKKTVLFLCLSAAFLAAGETLTPQINGNFAEKGRSWGLLAAKYGKVSFSDGVMELSRNDGAPYADVGNTRQSMEFRAGDKIELTFSAKGEGSVSAGFRMAQSGNVTKRFKLTPEFSTFTFTVDTAKLKLPEKGNVKFIIDKETSKVQIKECKVTISRI